MSRRPPAGPGSSQPKQFASREPAELFPPTPRGEDGSLDDLLYWLRAAERFLEVAKTGRVGKKGLAPLVPLL